MATKTKASTTNEPQRYLVASTERSACMGDQFFHITLRVCTQRYEQGAGYVPYGCDDEYGDGLYYSYLRVRCQGDQRSQQRRDEPVYGFDCFYHDVYTLDLRRGRRMIKTLETINRKLGKLAEQRGYVKTFGEYCGRVAEALGCHGIAHDRGKLSDATRRTGYQYEWMPIGEGVNRIDRLVEEWRSEPERREEERRQAEERQAERDRAHDEDARRDERADDVSQCGRCGRLGVTTSACDCSQAQIA